ncbi:MAG: hypothetical protein KF767_06115 [Bdellovibrionaceae bacterium]|nr:hypothetical protein [Pseudobdellovibrionaceae bacterium]
MRPPQLRNLILIAALQGLFTTAAFAQIQGLRISCNESIDYIEQEDSMDYKVVTQGQLLEIKEKDGVYRLKTGTVEAGGLQDALFGGSLSDCQVNAANAESNPPQYFLMTANCKGDDRAKDGPLTEISIARAASGFEVKTKTTVNVFGEISVKEKTDQFQHCSVGFND